MTFKQNPSERQFLMLAFGAVLGDCTPAESEELQRMLDSDPALREKFARIVKQSTLEKYEDTLELFLRVLFGTASSDEEAQLRGLQASNKKAWREFQEIKLMLQFHAAAEPSGASSSAPASIPDDIRRKLLSELN